MANGQYPLLIFPARAPAERSRLGGGGRRIHLPEIDRQRQRISPRLAVLQRALDERRVRLAQIAPLENPELVLVFEIVGSVDEFARAVRRLPSFEWLQEWAEDRIAQDDDFHEPEDDDRASLMTGRLYLLGTNQEALDQLLTLWDRYQRDPTADFDRGLAPFKHVFAQLREIRPWDMRDRVSEDVRSYWQDEVEVGLPAIRFEIEAWHYPTDAKNAASRAEIETLVTELAGRVLSRALIPEISYHGFLVEVPTESVARILQGHVPDLLLSDRIMFFRPRAQSISDDIAEAADDAVTAAAAEPGTRPPLVALLDGMPLANHALLAGRLIIDDPDNWEAGYEVKDRRHGTEMASLILHGPLDGPRETLTRNLYVRPVLRPDPADFHDRRREHTPDDVLLIDLIHRAIRRMFDGENGQPAAAPSVRIVNLSLGDGHRIFAREMSPWARLLDWLAHRYSLLFIVSAGNDTSPLTLQTPRDSLTGLAVEARRALALTALIEDATGRRLIAPAESINAITVGALHADDSQPPTVPGRFDLFAPHGISPISRVGHGFRRAVKPDVLMPGGRTLHMESYAGPPAVSIVEPTAFGVAPGHRTATPPMPGDPLDRASYGRGTSHAAALASRAAAQAHEVIENLRAQNRAAPGPQYDAVLLKALLVHGATWGDLSSQLLDRRPDLRAIPDGNERRRAIQDFLTRWLGYGAIDLQRAITCTEQRATLIGVGNVAAEEAAVFSAPLPPSLAGTTVRRRVTITLAWMSPINTTRQGYRRAKLWVAQPGAELRVRRTNSVSDKAALRGTVQHEVLEGEDAVAYVDGTQFQCKVNCIADAGELEGPVAFALCVSLEVAVESRIPIYEEIRARIAPAVEIRPG